MSEAETLTETPTTAAQIAEHLVALQERVSNLEDEIEQKDERIAALEDRVDDLESELQETRETAARERAELCGRVYDLEETETQPDSSGSNPPPDAESQASAPPNQPKTPLEQVVALPEHVVEDQLTANQHRARFLARDVRDYAESVPAGWMIASPDLRRILRAADESGHTQTAHRVMKILDDLGGDDVEAVDRHGTKKVVFTDDLVTRLQRLQQADHDVVMAAGA